MSRWIALFARPQAMLALIVGYCLAHGLFRVLISPSLGRDDLEEAIFAQTWDLGYNPRQPPLYTWMLRGLQDLLGPGVLAHTVLKFTLFFLLLLFLWLVARRLLGTRSPAAAALAGLAGAAPFVIVTFAWDALQLYTHSMVLAPAVAASLWALLRLQRPDGSGRLGDYLLLGLIFGLGLLSKYSFPLFLTTLLAAALADPVLRPRLLAWRMLPAIAVMLAVAAPHGWYLVVGPHNVIDDAIVYTLSDKRPLTRLEGIGAGLTALVTAASSFSAVPALVWLACFPGIVCRRLAADDPGSDPDTTRHRRLLARFMLLNIALALLAVLLIGFSRVQVHHMISPFLLLPLWFALRAQALEQTGQDLRRGIGRLAVAVLGLVGIAAVALGIKIVLEVDVYNCTRCYLHRPLRDIAARLPPAFTGGTVVTGQQLLAGGIQPFLPTGSRVLTLTYPFYTPRPRRAEGGQCLLLWDSERDADSPEAIARFIETDLRGSVHLTDPAYLSAPYYFSGSERRFRVGYVLIPGTGLCR